MESADSSTSTQQPNLPPGFRFHPTDEELVVHYLKKKASSSPLPVSIIADVDLYKFDPWELPAKATFGEQEWYFFSPRDRKYPNGARPNRAATSGYWKATGTDKPVMTSGGTQKVGVKKALVFYGGKPPKGVKTNWIMHEYRLADSNYKPHSYNDLANKKNSLRLDDWVLCRIYKKNSINRPPMDQEREDSIDEMIGGMPISSTPTCSMNMGHLSTRLAFPKMGTSYGGALLENNIDHTNFLEGFTGGCINTTSKADQLPVNPALKRTLSSLYNWNGQEDHDHNMNKKLHLEENDGNNGSVIVRTDHENLNGSMSSIAGLLSQLPHDQAQAQTQAQVQFQTPPFDHHVPQPILGSTGDGLLRQPYQVSAMNWYP